jgi:hypothetical protein
MFFDEKRARKGYERLERGALGRQKNPWVLLHTVKGNQMSSRQKNDLDQRPFRRLPLWTERLS